MQGGLKKPLQVLSSDCRTPRGYRAGWTPETLRMTMRENDAVLCYTLYAALKVAS